MKINKHREWEADLEMDMPKRWPDFNWLSHWDRLVISTNCWRGDPPTQPNST